MLPEDTLFSALSPIVSGRVYPNAFPQADDKPVWPAMAFSIRQDTNPDLCGSGDDGTDDITVEIEIAAPRKGQLDAISVAAEVALKNIGVLVVAFPIGEDFEPITKTHRARMSALMP